MESNRYLALAIELAVDARDFEKALLLAGRNEGPRLLSEWWDQKKIGKAEVVALLADVWSSVEWPSRHLRMRDWIAFFRVADYPKPAEPLQVYRGAPPPYARGMAWSTDIERARRFAERWTIIGRAAFVYTAVAQPDAVLADIDALLEDGGRGEHEIVVDPSRLGRITRLR